MKKLSTPFGDLSITVNGASVYFELNEHYENETTNLSGDIRILFPVEVNDEVLCTIEVNEEVPKSTMDTGEDYLCINWFKGSTILTVGSIDDGKSFDAFIIENGIGYRIKRKADDVVFGISWTTDYKGIDDLRTYFEADPS